MMTLANEIKALFANELEASFQRRRVENASAPDKTLYMAWQIL